MKAVAVQSTSDSGSTRKHKLTEGTGHDHSLRLVPPLLAVPSMVIQRKAGCACGGGCPECQEELNETKVARKPAISAPGDPLEEEADRTAQHVMRMPDAGAAPVGESSVPRSARGNEAPLIVHEVLRSAGTGLDSAARASMEPGFGRDLSAVRVHTDARAAESARAVNALAYTVGRDIVFAAGQYAPHTQAGARLLAHELAHTVQQPESVDVHPFLTIGRVDDPAERAADVVADTVMRGERASVSAADDSVLRRRTCTADLTDRPDQRLVHCDDGDYRVTLTTTTEPPRPQTQTSVSAGWDNNDIWLDIDICRGGTAAQIKPKIDLPAALRKALGNALAGSPALTGGTLSPGLQITVVQTDSFTLTLGPSINVDRTGVTGGGLTATVQTPDVTVSGGVSYDAPSRGTFFTLSLSGGSPQRHVDCTTKERRRLVFECERITHVPAVPEVPELKDEKIVYLFFVYPTAKIRPDLELPTEEIRNLSKQGYRVTSIEGFTSPEGPREQQTKAFEGNIALGQERADAAIEWLRKVACPSCDLSGVPSRGRSELPPQVGAAEPETKGPPMERDAVKEFLGADPGQTPDPLAPHEPADVAAFRRLSPARQRERAFELMRRAEITFTKVVQQAKPEVPARDDPKSVDCDPDVIDAARRSFGIDITTGAKILP
jgi:hypothetical protein